MSGEASPTALAAEALRLRAWALELLGGGAPGDAPRAGPGAWRVFLRVEACAVPLRNALRAGGVHPSGGEAELDAAAMAESQRLLSARAQVAWIDGLAAREGWRLAVLKGGVAVQGPQPLDVGDLDLLADPAHAPALLAALREAGYAAYGVDHATPGPRDHHYAPRWVAGQVPVEVHFRIPELDAPHDLLASAVPLEGARALLRLAPADHLRHLLLHTVAHHPQRRGRLRDLLLTAAAVGELSGAGVEEVRASLAASPFAGELDRTLGAAAELAEGRTPADAWRRMSGAVYVGSASAWVGRLPRNRQMELSTCLSAVLGCAEDRRRLWTRLWVNADKPSELPPVAWLEARSALAGGVVRTSVRIARYAAAAAGALPVARAARAAERRARRG
ncbi:MAG TPA: nucleotidyltransferase family protein [Longimicrobium sp.]